MPDKLPAWVARLVAVVATVAFTLLLIWTGLLYAQANNNREDIKDLTVEQGMMKKDLHYLVTGMDELKKSINRLEDKFGTRPAKK